MPHSSEPADEQALAVAPLKVLLHDLKNPLAHIQGTTELLRLLLSEKLGANTDYEQYLEILDLSTRRAMLLIQRVQLLDQLRQKRITCHFQPQALHLIVQETVSLYSLWARQRNIVLELNIQPVWVRADEGFLTQIVDNLLSNAVKHSLGGTQIRLEVSAGNSRGEIRISDDGPGLEASILARLFEPQEVTLAGAESPSGLGLAISRQLSELMQGQIGCESVEGQGASFYLSLPLASAPSPLSV